ncbi:Hypothetical protein A7982_05989 [Minicystis rosea]|nr:Hypothetical protein A7982_05989 [Minicystis rosea]
MIVARPMNLLLAAALAVAGCGTGGTTPEQDAGAGAGGGSGGSGGRSDTCGQCAIGSPNGWDYPVLVWIGDEKDAPECPAGAPKVVFEGHADLDAPASCGACSCGDPTGVCGLPATITANAATCALNGAATPHSPFDPTSGWTGACDADVAIGSGKLCAGVKCVQSVTIGPLTIDESDCPPSPTPVPLPPKWKTFARACSAFPHFSCEGGMGFCLAAPPPEAGFRVCTFHDGDQECDGPQFPPYTEKHVFYHHFEDSRACSECTCGAPMGSTCSASVSVYTDGACSALAYAATVSSSEAACNDVAAGSPLGSKSASAPIYAAGTCTPNGGEPMGAATAVEPSTYCCAPLP